MGARGGSLSSVVLMCSWLAFNLFGLAKVWDQCVDLFEPGCVHMVDVALGCPNSSCAPNWSKDRRNEQHVLGNPLPFMQLRWCVVLWASLPWCPAGLPVLQASSCCGDNWSLGASLPPTQLSEGSFFPSRDCGFVR